jgi:hypothetical protein
MPRYHLMCWSALLSLFATILFSCKDGRDEAETCQPAQMSGVTWVLVSFGDEQQPSSILPGLGEVTFMVHSDSLFMAHDGCNTTDGIYKIPSECSIAFFNAGTTLAGCGPLPPTPESIAINNQRREIILLLIEGGTFTNNDETLVIRTGDGRFLSFVKK